MASTGCDQIKPLAASTSQMPISNSSLVEYGEPNFEMIRHPLAISSTAEARNSRPSKSTEPAASEEALIRRVLLDIGGFPLFR
jgi:hypothetical protein